MFIYILDFKLLVYRITSHLTVWYSNSILYINCVLRQNSRCIFKQTEIVIECKRANERIDEILNYIHRFVCYYYPKAIYYDSPAANIETGRQREWERKRKKKRRHSAA